MSDTSKLFYTKNGYAAMKIARRLLSLEAGERIPRIDDFVKQLSTGRGTVQGALKLLEEMKAVCLETRGHMGTFLIQKDEAALWEVAGLGRLVGVMPLPYSRKYEGLATGLMESFESQGIPFSLAYMRGAAHRIETLRHGRYDFAVVSRFAGEVAVQKTKELQLVKGLGSGSYVSGHEVFFSNPRETVIRDGMYVGIDPSSTDQALLTEYECKEKRVQWVEISYMQLLDMLKEGKIDAAVWNKDEVKFSLPLGRGKLQSRQAYETSLAMSEAVVVTAHKTEEFYPIIDRLDPVQVRRVQQMVEQGETYPRY
ncbi:GntR family transcriptional regulator YhfZ [Paenactinomyces guangxiensis]|uniref:Transcriptional regulator n=1 Tax=Paenactinomyces guangxiensis TaxID=1490290 RepID=A0A7W2A7K2_9BACL|nr:GntR family transcriptional regulator YhfZ [Paenactinomyces guangxiensis]MBA4493217.1 transcriptional regulator [Paenactinomyces guangxiensis]MBH8589933.1 transcriptional regulator [Paenactinomyces guangxiensis]